jgi:hypothetical protein
MNPSEVAQEQETGAAVTQHRMLFYRTGFAPEGVITINLDGTDESNCSALTNIRPKEQILTNSVLHLTVASLRTVPTLIPAMAGILPRTEFGS